MAIEVSTDRDPGVPESEEVFIGGEGPYEFYFPKVGALLSKMRRAAVESKNEDEKGEQFFNLQMAWLERGFGEDTWTDIVDRLEDEEDVLEQAHVNAMFQLLLKAASGRPTTSSNGSSRSRSASKPKAARSRQASGSETSTSENSVT